MNVLSLFDGISCGQIALNRAGIKYKKYFASEIDKNAISVTMANYPNTIQIGDVLTVKSENLPKIDLLIGGSPCQGFSFAGKQLNFDDPRSGLFFEYVRILKECQPKYFLLENVKMKKEFQDVISSFLGVEPIEINSALVSAQNRKRLYWTNIQGVTQPEDKSIFLKDIIDYGFTERDKTYRLKTTYFNACIQDSKKHKRQLNFNKPIKLGYLGNSDSQGNRVYHIDGKTVSIVSNAGGKGGKTGLYEILKGYCRALTPIECERLQNCPDEYTDTGLSDHQRIKLLGNGWTVDIIAHIFKNIK